MNHEPGRRGAMVGDWVVARDAYQEVEGRVTEVLPDGRLRLAGHDTTFVVSVDAVVSAESHP